MGEKEQSSSHARVSERRKALAILPAAPPFAGRRKKRISGRHVDLSRESPTPERGAAATTSARALSRRGAHARVSPSLGVSRPVATRFAFSESDLGRGQGARGRKLSSKRGGSLGVVGYPVASRSFGRKQREIPERERLASRDRESGLGAGEDRTLVVVPARRLKCVAEVDGRCPDPEKRAHGSFLTKYRACVAGGLALLISRGATCSKERRRRRQRAKKHREPDRGGKAARSGKGEVRNGTKAVMRRRGVTRDRVTHRGKALRIAEARSFHEGVSQAILAAPDEAVRAKAPTLLGWGGDRSVRGSALRRRRIGERTSRRRIQRSARRSGSDVVKRHSP